MIKQNKKKNIEADDLYDYPAVGDTTTNEETIVEVITPREATFKGKPCDTCICIVKTPHGWIKPLLLMKEKRVWNTYDIEIISEAKEPGYHHYMKGIPKAKLNKIQRLLKKGLKSVVLE